jgi:hypothetical protein
MGEQTLVRSTSTRSTSPAWRGQARRAAAGERESTAEAATHYVGGGIKRASVVRLADAVARHAQAAARNAERRHAVTEAALHDALLAQCQTQQQVSAADAPSPRAATHATPGGRAANARTPPTRGASPTRLFSGAPARERHGGPNP